MDKQERFYQHFHEKINALKQQISQIGSEAPDQRREAHDRILAAISVLSTQVSDAADYVPAYDQRNYGQTIKAVQDDLRQTMTEVAPRSRFQFKSRRPTTDAAAGPAKSDPRVLLGDRESATVPPTQAAASSPQQQQPSKDYNGTIASLAGLVRRPSFSSASSTAITGHSHVHIALPAITQGSGFATNLSQCVLDISKTTHSTFILRDIDGSLIAVGKVDGPLHITRVSRSTLLLTAGQVRVHDCEDVDLYLHCGSRPIIERCRGMRFAPLPLCHQEAGYSTAANQWDQVDDFNWLKAGHSPNWSVLPEESRIKDEAWQDALGGEERPVSLTLGLMGLPR